LSITQGSEKQKNYNNISKTGLSRQPQTKDGKIPTANKAVQCATLEEEGGRDELIHGHYTIYRVITLLDKYQLQLPVGSLITLTLPIQPKSPTHGRAMAEIDE
jgi:hypothetical protein